MVAFAMSMQHVNKRCNEQAFKPIKIQPSAQQCPPMPSAATRRTALLSAGAMIWLLPAAAQAADVNPAVNDALKKYIKKKQYDPVDTYIPALLIAREQFLGLESVMVRDVAGARQALREGVFKSLREDVRAVADYAVTESGSSTEEQAKQLSTTFFRSLESYDRTLAVAVRNGNLDLPEARQKLQTVVADLDKVLALVPDSVRTQAQQVVDTVNESKKAAVSGEPTPADVQRLEKLLQ